MFIVQVALWQHKGPEIRHVVSKALATARAELDDEESALSKNSRTVLSYFIRSLHHFCVQICSQFAKKRWIVRSS